ncbi:MAG TPA: hypothetical protein VK638_37880 [Edaphobacter sp.]|nr:hypothetical protein [Edaphobacter sp.]
MSGAITAGTIIAGIGAAAGLGGTIYGVVNGQNQAATQQQALKNQTTAQQKAEASSLSTQRQAATAQNAVNQQTPDVSSILARAATAGNAGMSSTMLTGPGGVSPGSLNLGKSTLLGG